MVTAETITDRMIEVIRDVACKCRPHLPIESDEHAASHDCDVSTYDICVTALEALGEEADAARFHCAAVANDIIKHHGPASAYWRALMPLLTARTARSEGR